MNSKITKAIFLAICLGCLSSHLVAEKVYQWLQHPAISSDGKWIAFSCQGNIFKVATRGGKAIQLTSGGSYNINPVWNHDGSRLAFASDRNGNFDVYIMGSDGNGVKRLTSHSAQDIPYEFSADDKNVIFGTIRHDGYSSVRFPLERGLPIEENFTKLYQVSVNGGFNVLLSAAGMEHAHFNQTGDQVIYQDNKGSIDEYYRKHQVSSSTRDIWVFDMKQHSYSQLSSFNGEDREPLWGNNNEFYYLSERNGTFNLYKSQLHDTGKVVQLTFFKDHPLRSVSRSASGTFAGSFNGDIYTFVENGRPAKLTIQLPAIVPQPSAPVHISGAEEACLSGDGKQIAFTAHGDVYVMSATTGKIKQLTNTPYIEKMPSFSADGRQLAYAVENDKSWDIVIASLQGKGDFYADGNTIQVSSILHSDHDEFQPRFSPDGNSIAYVKDRDVLCVYDLRNHTDEVVLKEGYHFSSKDGDLYFTWSPDSKHLMVQSKAGSIGHENDVFLLSVFPENIPYNLTASGFSDIKPRFSPDGKSLYWLSDKNGLMNFTRSESQYDIFRQSIDAVLLTANPGRQKVRGSLPNRLTNAATDIKEIATVRQDTSILYLAKYQQGYDLWKTDLQTGNAGIYLKLNAGDPHVSCSTDGNSILLLDQGDLSLLQPHTDTLKKLKIDTTVYKDLAAERVSAFDHVYNRIRKRFYAPDLNGVPFEQYYLNYRKFLPSLTNNYDLAVVMDELLGELNTSHIAAYYSPDFPNGDETSGLGLLYDERNPEAGLLVKEVLKDGPFDTRNTHMAPGMVIQRIVDSLINPQTDWAALLNHQAGKQVNIEFKNPLSGVVYKENVRAIPLYRERSKLLYNRWITRMEQITDSLSGGKIGYLHIREMTDECFRDFYQDALGKYRNKEALIVDTRYNIGGSLHDELLTFLQGSVYLTERRQGRLTAGGESYRKWNKPSTVIVGEGNYSDAFLFPYLYQKAGIGKVIGMPVPGTGTGTVMEELLIPGMIFTIPQGATYGANSNIPTENHQLQPDIMINDNYNELSNGIDRQLETAIKTLLDTISK